jgi:hypothetical protein
MLCQLQRVVMLVIDELASIGRTDLIEPLHDLSIILRAVSADIADSQGFGEVVASFAQLVRTVRNVTGKSAIVRTFH